MIETERKVLHLFGPGYSGRAVKLRLLHGFEVDKAQANAVADAKGLEGREAGSRVAARTVDHALAMAIVAVTEPVAKSLPQLEQELAAATLAITLLPADATAEARGAAERQKKAAETALESARKTLDTWTPTTEADLSGWSGVPGTTPGEKSLQGRFKAKDLEMLAIWYRRYHEPSLEDVASILGNERTVA